MLYHLLYPLHTSFKVFNVFRYITFRTSMAILTALVVSLVLGPWLIRRLRQFQIGQEIREDGPASHHAKKGTPTMGGLLILLYALVLWRGLRTMARASSQIDMLVAGGIVAMIGFQVFVNIGMTVGIMPITGIPLPLMSYGGSHTLTTLMAIGLLLGIYQRRSAVPG